MAGKSDQADAWLQALNSNIDSHFGKKPAVRIKQFAKQYFASTPKSEISRLTDEEIYASVADAWEFLKHRQKSSPKITFINRKLTKDQQRQSGTSIYLLLDDMPFVVIQSASVLPGKGWSSETSTIPWYR